MCYQMRIFWHSVIVNTLFCVAFTISAAICHWLGGGWGVDEYLLLFLPAWASCHLATVECKWQRDNFISLSLVESMGHPPENLIMGWLLHSPPPHRAQEPLSLYVWNHTHCLQALFSRVSEKKWLFFSWFAIDEGWNVWHSLVLCAVYTIEAQEHWFHWSSDVGVYCMWCSRNILNTLTNQSWKFYSYRAETILSHYIY